MYNKLSLSFCTATENETYHTAYVYVCHGRLSNTHTMPGNEYLQLSKVLYFIAVCECTVCGSLS